MKLEDNCLLRTCDVIKITGISRSTIWRLEKNKKFPARKVISKNSVGWLKSEIMQWIYDRPTIIVGSLNGN